MFLRLLVLFKYDSFTWFIACWAWAAVWICNESSVEKEILLINKVYDCRNLYRRCRCFLFGFTIWGLWALLYSEAYFFEATKFCNGYLSHDGIRPVCWVNRPSAPSGAERCGQQALWEHKLNSQAHFKGRHVERQTPDEPLKQFHVKSTDIQISTMICQVSAEFTGAGIVEFHTPAPSPHSPPLSHHWTPLGSRRWWQTSAELSVCVCGDGWIHSPDKELCFYVFSCLLSHASRQVYYSNTELTVEWMKYKCGYNMQTVLVVKKLQGWCFRLILQLCWQINKQEQGGKEKMIMDFPCS